jgi:hypothetical protein
MDYGLILIIMEFKSKRERENEFHVKTHGASTGNCVKAAITGGA